MSESPDKSSAAASLREVRSLPRMQSPALRAGVLVGILLAVVMVVSLLLANRVPALEGLAQARNAGSYAAFAVVAALPVWVFRRQPGALFVAGIIAWGFLSLVYAAMGLQFEHLFMRLRKTPLNVFMLGAVVYGLLAVVMWVVALVGALRDEPVAESRRRP
ncbi:MAG: hypothetical protein ACRD5G_14095 [Candidatus Acidiferrales bacterium]